MAGKEHFAYEMTWVTSNPAPYIPNPIKPPSGTTSGTMSGTNTIYTNIIDATLMDNDGLEITWSGTPVGTIQVMCSISGSVFYALTFNPALTQPSGAPGGYLVDLNQVPFRYIMIQYTNTSGSGSITTYFSAKDLN